MKIGFPNYFRAFIIMIAVIYLFSLGGYYITGKGNLAELFSLRTTIYIGVGAAIMAFIFGVKFSDAD